MQGATAMLVSLLTHGGLIAVAAICLGRTSTFVPPHAGWAQVLQEAPPLAIEDAPAPEIDDPVAVEPEPVLPNAPEPEPFEPPQTVVRDEPREPPPDRRAAFDDAFAFKVRLLPPAVAPAAAAAQPPPEAAFVAASALDAENRPPEYPDEALRAGQEGTVLIELVVDEHGHVIAARVLRSSGHPLLDESALRCLRAWRFRAATRGGMAIKTTFAQPVQFRRVRG